MPNIQSNSPIGAPSGGDAKKVITTPETTTPKHTKVVTTEKSTAAKAGKAGKESPITPKTITEMTVTPGSGAAPVVKGGVRTAAISFDKAIKNIQDPTADWEIKTNSGYIPVGGYIEDGYEPKQERINSILEAAAADADHEAWQVRVDLLWALDKAWAKGFITKADVESLVWKMHDKEKDWRVRYNTSRFLRNLGYDAERVEIPRISNPDPLQRHTEFRPDDKPIVPVVEQPKLEQQKRVNSEYVEHLEVVNEKLEVNAREYEYQLEAQKSELDKLKRDLEGKDVEQRKLQEQIRNFQQKTAQVQETIQQQQNERAQLNQEIKQLNQEKKAAEKKVIEIEEKLAKEADKTARKSTALEKAKADRKRTQDRITNLIKGIKQAKALYLDREELLKKFQSELDKREIQLSDIETEKSRLEERIGTINKKINEQDLKLNELEKSKKQLDETKKQIDQKNAEIDQQKQSIAELNSKNSEVQTANDKLKAENKTLEQKIQELKQANEAKIAKLEMQLEKEQKAHDGEAAQLEMMKKTRNEYIEELEKEIAELTDERIDFEKKITEEFENKSKEQLEARAKLQQQIDALKAENQTVNAQLVQIQQNAQAQQQETIGTLNVAQQEIEQLKEKLRRLQEQADQAAADLQAQKTNYDNEINKLHTEHAITVNQVADQAIAELQAQKASYNNQINQLNTAHATTLNQVNQQLQAAVRLNTQNQTRIQDLTIELENNQAELQLVTGIRDNLNKELADTQVRLKDDEAKIVEFTNRVKALEDKNLELEGDIGVLLPILNTSTVDIRNLGQKIDQLEKDAGVARTELEKQDKQIARVKGKWVRKDMVKTTAPIAPMSAIEIFKRYQDNINSIEDIIACFTAFPAGKDSAISARITMQGEVTRYIQNNKPLNSDDIETLVKCFCDSIDKINEVNFTLATLRVFDTLENETAISDGSKDLIKKYRERYEPAAVPLQGAQSIQLPQLTYPEKKKPAKVLFSLKNIKSKDSATRLTALEDLNNIYTTAEGRLKTNIIKAMFGMLINDDDKNNTKQALQYITDKLGKATTTKNEIHLFIRGLKQYATNFPNIETSETAPILINDILPKFIKSYKGMLQDKTQKKYLEMLRASLEKLNLNAGDDATLEKIEALQASLK